MMPRALILSLLFAASASACLWRGYERIMTVHLDVLAGMVGKVAAQAESGRRPTPNDMTEMLYPLARARQFTGQFDEYAPRESYKLFAAVLDRYQALAQTIDGARTDDARWAETRQRIPAEAEALQQRVAAVRAALERGA
jgi:hypothetical protein